MLPERGPPQPSDDRYTVKVGQLVGNYRLEQLIGEGGMGVVFRAVHKDIGRKAAVKILYRNFARDPEFVTRFLNEARAVNLVGHPGLVEIFEFGCLPDETPYIIMEFLEGQSLHVRLIRNKKRLPLGQALSICRQMAVALAAAHDKGVVHRDLKPENVMLVGDPLAPGTERTKILDFGIAKLESAGGRKGPSLTRTGTTMGSPLYMAPEQCQELSTVTDKADVYALGVILYELLAGRTPFVAEMAAELMVMHVRSSPPPLRELAATTPEPVVDLVHDMLAKEPSKRPRMHKVAETLARLGITTQEGAATQLLFRRRRTLQTALGGVFGIGAALLVVGLVWHSQQKQQQVVTPTVSRPVEPSMDAGAVASPTPTTSAAQVEWAITTEPPGAQILDEASGDQMGHTPLTLHRPRRPGKQAVVLHLDGYRDVKLQFDEDRDLSIERQLVALPSPTPPPPVNKPITAQAAQQRRPDRAAALATRE